MARRIHGMNPPTQPCPGRDLESLWVWHHPIRGYWNSPTEKFVKDVAIASVYPWWRAVSMATTGKGEWEPAPEGMTETP